jgi:SAM-dependent methyltransferase
MSASPEFDAFADTYDSDLNRALASTGEDKYYFANGRVQWLRRCMSRRAERPRTILDYGCGTGDTCHLLEKAFEADAVVGVDVSPRSIEVARRRNQTGECSFKTFEEHPADGATDLAYCNGVFHHIPVEMRGPALEYVFRCLRPGGWFGFWENNPWNPGTRHVMAQCTFDRDAITIPPPQARKLVQDAGFEVVSTDYLFFFPRFLRMFRFLEPGLAGVPVGAQYQVLCRRPASGAAEKV